jgi:hypothetical protein
VPGVRLKSNLIACEPPVCQLVAVDEDAGREVQKWYLDPTDGLADATQLRLIINRLVELVTDGESSTQNPRLAADYGRQIGQIMKRAAEEAGQQAAAESGPLVYAPKTAAELMREYPEMRPSVIEGIARQSEIINIIAPPKTHKSWLVMGLAFDVATGGNWLDTFATAKGNVLIIDNELHPETCAYRLRALARARGLSADEAGARVHVENLRGRLQDFYGLGRYLKQIRPGQYSVIILDAFYRFLPPGKDNENDNGFMTSLYNELDRHAERLKCCFVLIHHASKGGQADKAVTDVGAGAGAQSRAADAHIILRHHEEEGAVVLDAALRSWKPLDPICLKWEFPTWRLAPDLDPTALRQSRRRKPKSDDNGGPAAEPPKVWTAESFAAAFVKSQPQPKAAIICAATVQGLSNAKANGWLAAAEAEKRIHRWKVGNSNAAFYSTEEQRLFAPTE